jgi:UDP-N-acetylmuramate--alanine ligase
MENNKKKSIYLVGIGGIGVSSLARYFHSEGFKVSGSDASSPPDDFKEKGINTFVGHSKDNLPEKTDLLIYSHAVSFENPEIKEAQRRKIEIKSYSEALGELTKKHYTIAIAGTHGKSTTTAMMSKVMIEAGLDPTVIIGTKLKEFDNTNFRKGESKYLVIEADESSAGFLNYYPKIALINNIEEDHLDFFNGIDDILDTFKKYITENVKNETLVINSDDKNIEKIKKHFKGELLEYSIKDNEKEKIKLSVPGEHNIYNALSVLCVSKKLGIKREVALKALYDFKGTWRRFDEEEITLSSGKKVKVINDYAHHPTEVRVTIKAVKEKYPDKKITAVFQPHQYKRTYHLFSQFREVFSSSLGVVDNFFITDIYSVKGRESEEIIKKINSEMLCDGVDAVSYSGSLEETGELLKKNLQEDDVLVIMGAGDIYCNLINNINI